MIRKPLAFIFPIFMSLVLFSSLTANTSEYRSILVIHGLDLHSKWANEFNYALFNSLDQDYGPEYNLHFEYLDLSPNSLSKNLLQYEKQLNSVMQKHRFDAVVAMFPPTVKFVMEHGDGLFKGIPKLLVISTSRQIEAVTGRDDYFCIANAAESNIYNTVNMIMEIHPELNRLYVINGIAPNDRNNRRILLQAVKKLNLKTGVFFLEGLGLDDMTSSLKALTPDSAVLLLPFTLDDTGRTYPLYELAPLICESSAVPVYAVTDSIIGRGVVGGNVTGIDVYAEKTAEYINIILEERGTIPKAYKGRISQYKFDWRQLKKWKISESKLPPGSKILYRQESFWMRYRNYVITGLAIFAIQAVLIITLLAILKRKNLAEIALMDSLNEQKTLIKELFHRTKNSMQIIHSFLILQAGENRENAEIQKLVQETGNRILAISLVHKKLYQSRHLSKLNFADYINELAVLIIDSYKLTKQQIDLQIDIDDMQVIIDMAVPCGVIVTELMSNTLKYAFTEDTIGKISISMKRARGNIIKLQFKDNGTGTPEDFDFRNQDSLGFKIVIFLAEQQLKGKVDYSGKNGICWNFSFPEDIYSERV